MIYNLSDSFEREQFTTRAKFLSEKGTVVELTEKRQRSLNQNNYLHAALGFFALQVGLPLQEVKEVYFKAECSPDIFLRTRQDDILVKERHFLRSSSELTTEEMSVAIDRFLRFASDKAGIYIPPSDEYIAVQRMQHEVQKNSRFL